MITDLACSDSEDLFTIEELETREAPGSWSCGCSCSCSCTSCTCVYSW